MKYPKQCHRLAAFYLAYELVRYGKPVSAYRTYTTAQADQWGRQVGLQPVPGPQADPAVIGAWEGRLAEVLKGRAAT